MAVTKIPKKTVTLIEPKKSFIVDKAQHRQNEWQPTAECPPTAKNSLHPTPIR